MSLERSCAFSWAGESSRRRASSSRTEEQGVRNNSQEMSPLVQEVLPVERVALRRTEASIADDPPQLFFGRAIGHARRAHYVFLEHHRANIVAAEAQAHLAYF